MITEDLFICLLVIILINKHLALTSINNNTSSKKLCGVFSRIAGSAFCINALGPRILIDKLVKPSRISFPKILLRSWIITQPILQPGTKNRFVSPPQVRIGTSLDIDDIDVNLLPENTKCSYISSAIIGTIFLEATSKISLKCSLS